eukprot:CAMPEP_0204273922 /NCGR_PEP_ID=MMETSP0468-20130131/24653_1 /ASSEMBLY_ACC=CAM_ASM_000383 /TAXON_ID=2969 /ORGANISM="Oxyrrhis marina" /LENGTH=254 /DNA_ID=CAMNT_0051250049 /DNA_START=27 /DNA_END=791 /DNA_ORIENTATION=+
MRLLLATTTAATGALRGTGCALGMPTHFNPVGCVEISEVVEKIETTDHNNNVDKCFLFCNAKAGMDYFGVSGSTCWCGHFYRGAEVARGKESVVCDARCPGRPKETCGGEAAANVYRMIECVHGVEGEKRKQQEEEAYAKAKRQHLLDAFVLHDGMTCGQDEEAKIQVHGSETLVGSEDECKLACWDAYKCGGFTYDRDMSRCIFLFDTLSGERKEGRTNACYTKQVGGVNLRKVAKRVEQEAIDNVTRAALRD